MYIKSACATKLEPFGVMALSRLYIYHLKHIFSKINNKKLASKNNKKTYDLSRTLVKSK